MFVRELLNKYVVSSPFGERIHPVTKQKTFHNGIDIAVPFGTNLIADKDYSIVMIWSDNIGGNQIKISDDKYVYGFAHLSYILPELRNLKEIKAGTCFARTGGVGEGAGASTGAHLHFTMREKDTNRLIDPLKYLVILLALFLFGCSASQHIDRAITKKSPSYVIGYVVEKYGDSYLNKFRDTIVDTIYTQGFHIDTMIVSKKVDTIVINKDNVSTIIYKYYDTLRVISKMKADTIYKIKYIDRYNVQPLKSTDDEGLLSMRNLLIVFFLSVVVFLIVVILRTK